MAKPIAQNENPQDSSDADAIGPLSLFSSYESIHIELRKPHHMPCYHWHGQIEVNIPFGDDVDYVINDHPFTISNGHIGIFWATTPHQLIEPGKSSNMGILNIPIHYFLAWPLDESLLNQITHGTVVQSALPNLVTEQQIAFWMEESKSKDIGFRQLAADEMSLMLKRVCLTGWEKLTHTMESKGSMKGLSKHSQFHVQKILEYIACNHDAPLTVKNIAEHVGLHTNYAMNLFQSVMKMTIKEYVTSMRINHARALLTDTNRTILDIALTVGFNSNSRFYETFQRYMKMTPTAFRKLSRKSNKLAQYDSNLDFQGIPK
ncbi:transcriptional regulator MelR [Photobacterium rosenbergii]|uniref:transcriptional regulator MelR n=1 Tax=Photobacterium rosenbergii TaxID=294936 RepID=UPI001C995B13|nr:transcriptional regulator MelR [Photobacterium rosenbergii]MBY5945141.1 transcriptional regulator MelR [Photobacterium rosenbergii]